MEDSPGIMWNDEFPLHRVDRWFPEYAAFCISMAECMIADGEDVHDAVLDAVGSVSAYACGIAEDDLASWMMMLDYGSHGFRDLV